MNEEDMKLWLALLKEWLNELDCTDVVEHPTGISFTYREIMEANLDIDGEWEAFNLYVWQHRGVSVVDYDIDGYVKLSEVDICNPNITPSERFHPLKPCLDGAFNLLEAHDAFSVYAENTLP